MIKPDTLWNLFKHGNVQTIGRVCVALANREDELDSPLNEYELMFYNMIREAEEWMDEAVNAVKTRKHNWYMQKKQEKDLTSNPSNASNVSIDHPPSVRPSVRPSNNKLVHTEPTPIARTRTRVKESGRVGSESVRVANIIKKKGKDWWSATDDDIRYPVGEDGEVVMLWTILHNCFGSGGWRKAITQAGEDAVRELFLTFRSEMAQGELPKNAAAAFTQRLQTDLGVDFSKSLAESAKIKAANGV